MRRIKLMPDYECYCLWDMDDPHNIDPSTLAISDMLKSEITDWENIYDKSLSMLDPRNSGLKSHEIEPFEEKGKKIFEALKKELPEYCFYYFSISSCELIK